MFTVTEAAQKELKVFFMDREVKPVRIFLLNQGGCCGPKMAMDLDEKDE